MSILRFSTERKAKKGGKPLHWGRAETDGAPFRGNPPLLREEEFDDKTIRSCDCFAATFDTSKPESKKHGRTYHEVLDGISNDWFFQLSQPMRRWVRNRRTRKWKVLVYIEWAEPYVETRPTDQANPA